MTPSRRNCKDSATTHNKIYVLRSEGGDRRIRVANPWSRCGAPGFAAQNPDFTEDGDRKNGRACLALRAKDAFVAQTGRLFGAPQGGASGTFGDAKRLYRLK